MRIGKILREPIEGGSGRRVDMPTGKLTPWPKGAAAVPLQYRNKGDWKRGDFVWYEVKNLNLDGMRHAKSTAIVKVIRRLTEEEKEKL